MLDIPGIMRESFVPRAGVASVHLRPSGNSWSHIVTLTLRRGVARQILHQQRAWAHQRHVPAEHVPEFRQFVETGRAKELSKRGQALRVVERMTAGVTGVAHSAKLDKRERTTVEARALLTKEHRCTQCDVHGHRDHRQQRREEHEQDRRDNEVEGSLDHEPRVRRQPERTAGMLRRLRRATPD